MQCLHIITESIDGSPSREVVYIQEKYKQEPKDTL